MSDLTNHIGERIRYYRKERKLSQEELAYRAALHTTYIGQLERGEKNVTLDSLAKVCVALDITLSEFFSEPAATSKMLSIELTQIISLLDGRPKKDQQKILSLVESLIQWKDE
ncbi:helix-turn-helix domain-containing protein [Caryophanon tenue]|uniref:Transcriptional regulator n=1 Tax=Caryophanon tenue TaxID=33978 RepID=A0A1C0YJ10_9BACL|nr:helix-turn-helix transcriptional regulator [Caryophanon tenue]OCS87157.1 transcriptional regulator [Caryophanon tenue]